jgi:hypothetical protein
MARSNGDGDGGPAPLRDKLHLVAMYGMPDGPVRERNIFMADRHRESGRALFDAHLRQQRLENVAWYVQARVSKTNLQAYSDMEDEYGVPVYQQPLLVDVLEFYLAKCMWRDFYDALRTLFSLRPDLYDAMRISAARLDAARLMLVEALLMDGQGLPGPLILQSEYAASRDALFITACLSVHNSRLFYTAAAIGGLPLAAVALLDVVRAARGADDDLLAAHGFYLLGLYEKSGAASLDQAIALVREEWRTHGAEASVETRITLLLPLMDALVQADDVDYYLALVGALQRADFHLDERWIDTCLVTIVEGYLTSDAESTLHFGARFTAYLLERSPVRARITFAFMNDDNVGVFNAIVAVPAAPTGLVKNAQYYWKQFVESDLYDRFAGDARVATHPLYAALQTHDYVYFSGTPAWTPPRKLMTAMINVVLTDAIADTVARYLAPYDLDALDCYLLGFWAIKCFRPDLIERVFAARLPSFVAPRGMHFHHNGVAQLQHMPRFAAQDITFGGLKALALHYPQRYMERWSGPLPPLCRVVLTAPEWTTLLTTDAVSAVLASGDARLFLAACAGAIPSDTAFNGAFSVLQRHLASVCTLSTHYELVLNQAFRSRPHDLMLAVVVGKYYTNNQELVRFGQAYARIASLLRTARRELYGVTAPAKRSTIIRECDQVLFSIYEEFFTNPLLMGFLLSAAKKGLAANGDFSVTIAILRLLDRTLPVPAAALWAFGVYDDSAWRVNLFMDLQKLKKKCEDRYLARRSRGPAMAFRICSHLVKMMDDYIRGTTGPDDRQRDQQLEYYLENADVQ